MAKGAAGRTSNDYRKLRNMLEDLRKIKSELLPGKPARPTCSMQPCTRHQHGHEEHEESFMCGGVDICACV